MGFDFSFSISLTSFNLAKFLSVLVTNNSPIANKKNNKENITKIISLDNHKLFDGPAAVETDTLTSGTVFS